MPEMSKEQLEEIRERCEKRNNSVYEEDEFLTCAGTDMKALLAEVERLRGENAELEAFKANHIPQGEKS